MALSKLTRGSREDELSDRDSHTHTGQKSTTFTPDPSWPSIEELAIERWGQPNKRLSTRDNIRFGTNGSKSVKPSANVWRDHETGEHGGYVEIHRATRGDLPKRNGNGKAHRPPPWQDIASIYDYTDADGHLILQAVRTISGSPRFLQRRPIGNDKWTWSVKDIPGHDRLLYRLPGLRASGDETVWITEGEKDADRLHGEGLIATTNIGGAGKGKWRDEYAEEFRGKPVIVLQDNDDAGRDHAAAAARSLDGVAASVRVLLLPNLPPKGDVSDWLDADGTVEELHRLAREAPEYGEESEREAKRQSGRLRILSVDDLLELPARDYLVKGWISPNEISLIVGAKNTRKTFLALHTDYAISQGRRVFGRRVKQAPVLFLICEGDKGIAKRIQALARRYGRSQHFHVIAQPVDLLRSTVTEGDLHDLIEAARAHKVRKITVDTVSRVMPGGKENSPEDMGALLGNLTVLRDATGAHVMGVHHGTKEDGTNSRGHSILPNGVDAIAQTEWAGDGNGIGTVSLGFARDDEAGALGAFRTELVELDTDADGDPITTLLIEELDPAEKRGKAPDSRKLPDVQAHMLDVIRNAFAKGGGEPVQPAPDMPIVSAFQRTTLRAELSASGWFSEEHLLSSAFQDGGVTRKALSVEHNAMRGLKRRGFLAFTRDYVWLL